MALPGKTDWTQVDPAFAAWLEEYLRPVGRINAKSEQLLYDAWKAARAHEASQADAPKTEVERDALVVGPDEPKAIEQGG
jgi:hypothetical protein